MARLTNVFPKNGSILNTLLHSSHITIFAEFVKACVVRYHRSYLDDFRINPINSLGSVDI